MPHWWHGPSQTPAENRPPLKNRVFASDPPNRTVVPGAPRAPGNTPTAGPVVTSGGSAAPRIHHIRYSARPQTRSAGQSPPHPHMASPQGAVKQPAGPMGLAGTGAARAAAARARVAAGGLAVVAPYGDAADAHGTGW